MRGPAGRRCKHSSQVSAEMCTMPQSAGMVQIRSLQKAGGTVVQVTLARSKSGEVPENEIRTDVMFIPETFYITAFLWSPKKA